MKYWNAKADIVYRSILPTAYTVKRAILKTRLSTSLGFRLKVAAGLTIVICNRDLSV